MSKGEGSMEADLVPTKDCLTTPPQPDGAQQRERISSLQGEEESVHVYCLAKAWYTAWQAYAGMGEAGAAAASAPKASPVGKPVKGSTQALPPGPLYMDLQDEEKNTYIDEKIWRCWVEWYGVAESHQLDRRNWASDDKEFEICILSPFSGIVANPTKAFDISEETGYIELQLRKIFKVPRYRNTRLWACEKARNARFHLVLDRTQEICYQDIDSARAYILALEIANADNSWPTHMPGEPRGSLSKYASLTGMGGTENSPYWERELEATVDAVFTGISAELRETVTGVVSTTKCITAHKERDMEVVKDKLETKLHHLSATEKALERRARDVAKEEEGLRGEKKRVMKDRATVDRDRQQLKEEIIAMEALNKITDARVKLNIGGHVYMTSTLTLTKDPGSMLSAMFSGRHSLKREDDGSYFIDRDGTHFRFILNYLRDGGFKEGTLPTENTGFLTELLTEAEYYGITGLVTIVQSYLGKLSPGDAPGNKVSPVKVSKRKIALLK